jgi:hypothetical protein
MLENLPIVISSGKDLRHSAVSWMMRKSWQFSKTLVSVEMGFFEQEIYYQKSSQL